MYSVTDILTLRSFALGGKATVLNKVNVKKKHSDLFQYSASNPLF